MAIVFHRTWAQSTVSILFGEGFRDNQSGFVWVANIPLQPYIIGNVLSDKDSTAGGDSVIRIEIDDTELQGCKRIKKPGCDYIEVPASN